jgi:membrane associated rhomboid family serine protease
MLIPLRAQVPMDIRPWANYAIIAVTWVVSCWGFSDERKVFAMAGFERSRPQLEQGDPNDGKKADFSYVDEHGPWVLRRTLPAPIAALTSTFANGGLLHLLGNMWFLWVFGNAVNYKFGHIRYVGLYMLAALAAGLTHDAIRGTPSIGASGAINGVVAAFLVFFPRNDVTVLWGWNIVVFRVSELSSYWVILAWLVWDVLFLCLNPGGGVAFAAHVGGFAAGFALAMLAAATGWVKPRSDEQTLLQVFGIGRERYVD